MALRRSSQALLRSCMRAATASGAAPVAPAALQARSFASDADLLKTPLYDYHLAQVRLSASALTTTTLLLAVALNVPLLTRLTLILVTSALLLLLVSCARVPRWAPSRAIQCRCSTRTA